MIASKDGDVFVAISRMSSWGLDEGLRCRVLFFFARVPEAKANEVELASILPHVVSPISLVKVHAINGRDRIFIEGRTLHSFNEAE